jgi:hypothetical protein
MQEMDNMATGTMIQRPLGLRLSAFHVGLVRISNRKYSALLLSPRRIALSSAHPAF